MTRLVLSLLRWLRRRVPGVSLVHAALREPYYRALEFLNPRGIVQTLSPGYRVRFHPRLLGMCVQQYEPAVTTQLLQYLKPGAVVLDIGAHVGLHTLMFSRRVGADGRVLAIEPSPANAGMLRNHLLWNDCRNVDVIEAAVSNEGGNARFSFRKDAMDPGGFANSLAYDIGGASAKVQVSTIDEICSAITPDLIKMDVEGAELLALRGAQKTLSRLSPTIIVAIHPEPMHLLQTSPAEFISLLNTFGYQGRNLSGSVVADPGAEEIVFTR